MKLAGLLEALYNLDNGVMSDESAAPVFSGARWRCGSSAAVARRPCRAACACNAGEVAQTDMQAALHVTLSVPPFPDASGVPDDA